MPKVISDLHKGKSIQLTYRHKIIAILRPANIGKEPLQRGSPAALRHFLASNPLPKVPDSVRLNKKSIKQQIRELRDKDFTDQK